MPTDSVTFENLVLDATFRSDLAAEIGSAPDADL
jgi:hypothetical protein